MTLAIPPLTKQAATGVLTGLALGDALGFPTEFNDVPSILAKFGPWRQMPLLDPAVVSDDTQMTIALGRGIRTAMDSGAAHPRTDGGPGQRRVHRLVPRTGQQPGPRQHLPHRLPPAGEHPDLAAGQPDALQGLRRQHAGRPRRPRPRPQRGAAGRRRPAPGRPHPRPPHRPDRLRPAGPRGVPARPGCRTARPDRAVAQLRPGEPGPLPHPLARRPLAPRGRRHPAGVHPARLGRVPGGSGDRTGRPARPVAGDRPVRADRRRLDRRGGPRHRPALLPALPRGARHRPAPGRLHPGRLGLHRLPDRSTGRGPPGRGGLAQGVVRAHRVPQRPAVPRGALGRL
ncbi:LOW QUALITY PROTEIN: ADP-ribosylglycohydrolase, partial [Streptomyces filamentosus NRRL 15998]